MTRQLTLILCAVLLSAPIIQALAVADNPIWRGAQVEIDRCACNSRSE